MSEIIVPIHGFDAKAFEAITKTLQIKQKEQPYDYLELDLEGLTDRECAKRTKEAKNIAPIIGISRSVASESELIATMKVFLLSGGAFFDLDVTQATPKVLRSIDPRQLILSFHDYEKIPDEETLKQVIKVMEKTQPHIGKFAVTPLSEKEMQKFLDWCEGITGRKIITTMGKYGEAGRIEIEKRGLSWGDYWALNEKSRTAVGQRVLPATKD